MRLNPILSICFARCNHLTKMASVYKNPTEVEMNKYVSHDSAQQRSNQALLAGELLKAMDTVACLSAEKHAKMPCVTLTMDDLVEINETSLSHGQVLNLKARLTRAFTSSMEVLVEVAFEDPLQRKKINICQAFFTFVATPKHGKANLKHLDPITIEERLQYALAAERRKMRFAARNEVNTIHKHQAKIPEDFIAQSPNTSSQFTMTQTCVESIELVLPSHANHHQTTFGGQIMAWLVSVCTISASRLCHSVPSIVAVNGIQFYGPSSVGDRLVFKAMVNQTFNDNSMEVGCRVEAWSIDGETRHINSAYLIFVDVIVEDDQHKPLPNVIPTTTDELQRQTNANNRRQFQVEKKKILESVGPALSVPWSQANSSTLALNNVSAFRALCQLNNWEEVSREGETSLSKCTQDQLQCIKVEAIFPTSACELFNCLKDNERAAWDPIFAKSETVREIDDSDKIVHLVMATADNSAKADDVLVLQSNRAASSKSDDYVIAYRSITWESLPAGHCRKENLSSGFLIQESEKDPGKSSLIYINQLTAQVASYLFSDLTGKTKTYVKRIDKLQSFISKTLKHI